MPLNKDRKKDIMKLLNKFRKDHDMDENSKLGFMSDNENIGLIEHLQTGNIGIDTLSNGGLIKGKVNILYGGENSGKSTLMLDTIAHQQKLNPNFIAALCDNEKVFDREYAISKGIDPDRLIVGADFNTAEQAYDFCNDMASSGLIDLLIVDTIQALASKGEMVTKKGAKKSTEDDTMALIPRLLSQFLRMYTSQSSGNVTLVLLSQVRLDLGSFMPSAKKTGGKAIDHYNVLTIKLVSTKAHSGSEKYNTKWPWTVTEDTAPHKSFTLRMRIDKAKMQGRYDGNALSMHFHQGDFEHKLNVLAIAKQLNLHDGKTLKYKLRNSTLDEAIATNSDWQEEEKEFKAKGFHDMYNRVPDEAIIWLSEQLKKAYDNQILIVKDNEDGEIEPETGD